MYLIAVFLNFFLAIIIAEAFSFVLCHKKMIINDIFYALLIIFLWILFNLILWKFGITFDSICIIALFLFFLLLELSDFHLNSKSKNLEYDYVTHGNKKLFDNKKVMIIVPHEDDDMNVASGIIEQYVNSGSNIYLVFTTNGDYWDFGSTRIQEAIEVSKYYKIPENHIIFLGYADGWSNDNHHIYNATPNEKFFSRNGYSRTYALKSHPAYNDGVLYTYQNYLNDMKNLILEYLPDTIICSDFDPQIEHKATTLFFEKAVGEILKEKNDYHPIILKSFAYCTSWLAPKDYYKTNLLSTIEPSKHDLIIYSWNDRIRLPIYAEKLSRSLVNCDLYKAISLYRSQRANIASRAIINGDKVFWLRRTDSFLYRSNVRVSSGDAHYLTDFMYLNSDDISDPNHEPFDSLWVPNEDDVKRTAWFTFDKPRNLENIILFENPSIDDHIIKLRITLSNGMIYEISDIKESGTNIVIHQNNVSGFYIEILEFTGKRAGLTEIEAYEESQPYAFSYVKIMDEHENFVYDYYIDIKGTQNFKLYHYGNYKELDPSLYNIECDNDNCKALIIGNKISVNCPVGQKCHLYLRGIEEDEILDMVTISNPTDKERLKLEHLMRFEEFRYHSAIWIYYQTVLYRYGHKIKNKVECKLKFCGSK